jgi:protein-tyrosine phosphatase family protein
VLFHLGDGDPEVGLLDTKDRLQQVRVAAQGLELSTIGCSAGAAASMLMLLGVSEEDVFADYMLTNETARSSRSPAR